MDKDALITITASALRSQKMDSDEVAVMSIINDAGVLDNNLTPEEIIDRLESSIRKAQKSLPRGKNNGNN